MLCNKMIILLFFAMYLRPVLNQPNTTNNISQRRKRQDDEKWSWGYFTVNEDNTPKVVEKEALVQPYIGNDEDPTTTTTITTTTITTTTTEVVDEDPCNRPLITKPDFAVPGRRKSDIKCLEYIWNIRLRLDVKARYKECIEYTIRENERKKNGIRFAIGGRDAYPGEFPHMAALGWKAAVGTWIFKCGGSLISDKFVLTAAHCTKVSPIDTTVTDVTPKIVRMGDRNILDKRNSGFFPSTYNISNIIVHPDYKPPKKYFDIALLELEKRVIFEPSLQPACLWNKFDTSNLRTAAQVTGWGVVATGSRTTPTILQVVNVDMIDSQTCDTLLRPNCNRNWCGIQDHQVCAGKLAGGIDACQGDSGGPLQEKINIPNADSSMYHVIGITSFGYSCALPNTPGVYTRVSAFLDWIESIVWP